MYHYRLPSGRIGRLAGFCLPGRPPWKIRGQPAPGENREKNREKKHEEKHRGERPTPGGPIEKNFRGLCLGGMSSPRKAGHQTPASFSPPAVGNGPVQIDSGRPIVFLISLRHGVIVRASALQAFVVRVKRDHGAFLIFTTDTAAFRAFEKRRVPMIRSIRSTSFTRAHGPSQIN